ncbi:TMV resistance protein N-like [Abrus precatorius]|uniref:TMV resistance protein N-like n=1 Tax=Abrus precatorius TaxID=3816 RepID=A0A8B8LLQ3_ABRPR|nr:TMV resistance protein N-like [Abrus precatorius]
MAGAETSSSSSFSNGFTYDVFVSFKGSDTSHSFTGILFEALCERGINTFMDNDDEEFQIGEEIRAIEKSKVAIVVFSKNYASSSRNLNQLVNIIECCKKKGRLVMPVFYDVDPSVVQDQRGAYGQALAEHGRKFKDNPEKVKKWRRVLKEASLFGWYLKPGVGYEYEYVKSIVEEVFRRITNRSLFVADYTIGLDSRVEEVCSLLYIGSAEVRMVGIYGIGGIGKTILAKAVYNDIADGFEASCFLGSVREIYDRHGSMFLQEMLLNEILGKKDIRLGSVDDGISIIKERLQHKRVLLILDDISKLEQLEALAGSSDWFGSGSRVIITTRNKHLLTYHRVEITYEVQELNNKDALELFSRCSFKDGKIDPSYVDISKQAIDYASGHPLALRVIGSNLLGRSKEEWEHALQRFKRIPLDDIQDVLKVSFDALEEEEKKVFLDIACCFNGYKLTEVEDILCAHRGDHIKLLIRVLIDKSLISISSNSKLILHSLIEDMGKNIVYQESPHEPGQRSRLWFSKDIIDVLQKNTGSTKIEIIHLGFPLLEEEEVQWNVKAFKKMKNLKTLIIRNGQFSRGPKHLPNSLKVLEWWRYPSEDLPSDFDPKKLAILKLPNTHIVSPELAELLKKFLNLRALNFGYGQCKTHISHRVPAEFLQTSLRIPKSSPSVPEILHTSQSFPEVLQTSPRIPESSPSVPDRGFLKFCRLKGFLKSHKGDREVSQSSELLPISERDLKVSPRVFPEVLKTLRRVFPEVLKTLKRALQADMKWKLVGLGSSVTGLTCHALSPSFNRLIKGWNSFKFVLYGLLSLVICATILFAGPCSQSRSHVQLKSCVGFAVLMIISVYSYYYDRAVNGNPEILSLVSNALFALMSLSFSKRIKFGFEMGIFCYFIGCFAIQLVSINFKLILVAMFYGCPLFIVHSQPEIQNGG